MIIQYYKEKINIIVIIKIEKNKGWEYILFIVYFIIFTKNFFNKIIEKKLEFK